MLESFIAEPKFAMWNIVSGVLPETNMNLFAMPSASHSSVIIDVMNILRLKNSDTESVSIIIAVLKMNASGVSMIYDANDEKEFLLKISIQILVTTAITAIKVIGLEYMVSIIFFIRGSSVKIRLLLSSIILYSC